MNAVLSLARFALPAVALSLSVGQASAVTLIADNFDSYSYALSTQAVGGWKTSATPFAAGGANGGVDVIGATTPYDFYPGNGNYIDLSGVAGPTFFYNTGTANALITLGYTGPVTVSFDFDLGQNPGGSAGQTVTVYYGSSIGNLTFSVGSVLSTTQLTHHHLSFSGPLTSLPPLNTPVMIGFLVSTTDGQGPILDNVRLDISPVPEPSGYAMMLAGMAALGTLALRRRRLD